MSLREIEALLQIRGGTSLIELMHLYGLARRVRSGCIVEIGGYQGRSTAALALGSRQGLNVPVYCIEPHETFTGVLGAEFGPHDRTGFFWNMVTQGLAEQAPVGRTGRPLVT